MIKSTHIKFTNTIIEVPPLIKIDDTTVLYVNKVKYLAMNLDVTLK